MDKASCRGQEAPLPPFVTKLAGMNHKEVVTCLFMSSAASERYIVTGSSDTNLMVYDRFAKHRISKLVGHVDRVSHCFHLNLSVDMSPEFFNYPLLHDRINRFKLHHNR